MEAIVKNCEAEQTDNEILKKLQDEYKNGDKQALILIYEILKTVAYKYINKLSVLHKNVKKLSSDERGLKSHDAATLVIEKYLKNEDFFIDKSITGYLYKCVLFVLFYHRKCDTLLIYTDTLPEKTNKTKYKYIVRDINGNNEVYNTSYEVFQKIKGLTKKKFIECIRNNQPFKNYYFELLEV